MASPNTWVQVGGPLGAYLPPSRFDLPMDYEAFAAAGAMVGHGGIVVFDDTVDMAALLPLGYPAPQNRYGPTNRRAVEDVTFDEGWGRRWEART